MNNRLRSSLHDRCKQCQRWAYDPVDRYCMSCGHSESSPIWGALLMVGICFTVLVVVGWLMS